MTRATFDLSYVETAEGRTMTAGVFFEDGRAEMIGPFPAAESGPRIVDALAAIPELGFADRKEAETAYTVRHFYNYFRKQNDAGQAYPMVLI